MLYKQGSIKAKPTAKHNVESWTKINRCLINPGYITSVQLSTINKQHNNGDFIKYCLDNLWITELI